MRGKSLEARVGKAYPGKLKNEGLEHGGGKDVYGH